MEDAALEVDDLEATMSDNDDDDDEVASIVSDIDFTGF